MKHIHLVYDTERKLKCRESSGWGGNQCPKLNGNLSYDADSTTYSIWFLMFLFDIGKLPNTMLLKMRWKPCQAHRFRAAMGITMENCGILFKVLSAFSANCLAWKFPYRNASTSEVCTPESMEMACAISVLRRIRSTIQTARCRSTSVRCSCKIVKMGCTASAWFSTCTPSPTRLLSGPSS